MKRAHPTCGGRDQVRILGSATGTSCVELAEATGADPAARTPGRCEECAALGEQNWAHLRMCLTVGMSDAAIRARIGTRPRISRRRDTRSCVPTNG